MAKYSTLVFEEDKDAPKKKRDTRWSKPLNVQKDKDSGRGKEEGPDGVWRTVRGRHIFIEEGKTLEQALGHKPGVENQKKLEKLDRKIASVKKHQAKIDAEVADDKRKKKYFL